MGVLILLSCFVLTCYLYCVHCSPYTLRFLMMYNVNGQQRQQQGTTSNSRTEFLSEPVPQEFVTAWTAGDVMLPTIFVTKINYERMCSAVKAFGQLPSIKEYGLFVTYSVASTVCANQDRILSEYYNNHYGNASIIISTFRIRPSSHQLSLATTSTLIKYSECCMLHLTSGSLAVLNNEDVAVSQDLLLFTNGNVGPTSYTASNNTLTFLSKNSIFFVAISFIVLMIISLGWLAFYYVERFRNAHTKEYISKRIAKAAKKALSKMPLKTIRGNGADDVNYQSEQCTVCIEQFRQHDTIRILPCKHLYHKACIDPWLMENHTCPVCKLDILTASGIELPYGRYNCDLESTVAGRSLELYPVQLDLLMHAPDSASPDSSASGGGEQEIQLVHIRPPAVQVHSHPNYFRSSHSRRSSASSSSRLQVTPYGKVDEADSEHVPSPYSCASASSSEEMSKLLTSTANNNNNETSATGDAGSKSKLHSRRSGDSPSNCVMASLVSSSSRRHNSSAKNVACVVDVIAPATPPLDAVALSKTLSCSGSETNLRDAVVL